MAEPWCAKYLEGRLRAAFFWLVVCAVPFVLSACSVRPSAPVATLLGLLPGGSDVAERAATVPFASIDFRINDRGGLLVLAERQRALTYWQSAGRETIVLENGYLDHTAGLATDLMMTRFRVGQGMLPDTSPWRAAQAGEPFTYVVQRQWQSAGGMPHTDTAQATLVCETQSISVELPLTTLSLQRCNETLVWSGGARTYSTLWRSPQTHRLWAMATVPWPGAPSIEWQVARPWW